VSFVTARVADFAQQASKHRLNQVHSHAQSSSLKAASEVKLKTAALRQQAKAETVTIYGTLWTEPQPRATLKKVCHFRKNTCWILIGNFQLLQFNLTATFNTVCKSDNMLMEMVQKGKGVI
jgi:hypothetical protein